MFTNSYVRYATGVTLLQLVQHSLWAATNYVLERGSINELFGTGGPHHHVFRYICANANVFQTLCLFQKSIHPAGCIIAPDVDAFLI